MELVPTSRKRLNQLPVFELLQANRTLVKRRRRRFAPAPPTPEALKRRQQKHPHPRGNPYARIQLRPDRFAATLRRLERAHLASFVNLELSSVDWSIDANDYPALQNFRKQTAHRIDSVGHLSAVVVRELILILCRFEKSGLSISPSSNNLIDSISASEPKNKNNNEIAKIPRLDPFINEPIDKGSFGCRSNVRMATIIANNRSTPKNATIGLT
ncbi:uncharacterized protein G2W53_011234 [Senna tora]|uniref:Uncharacterized protein n=1 Tax=Senna tora TaxID=362788 RepID=A0A834X0V9_9FABA|nr:uncharacterized protein G2W53_011234 [Senna tora]